MNATLTPAPTSNPESSRNNPQTPDFAAIKAKQHKGWSAGDYSVVGSTLQIVGEQLCETLDVRADETLLDVAAGNGNVSLAAARRYCQVTSTDYVEELLMRGKQRAIADGLSMEFRTADAEALPFVDGAFDVVTSSFGVMFTPNHSLAASELARVTRSGGRIGLANWTPTSFIGGLFKTLGKYLPPPAGTQSPALWGTQPHLEDLFGANASNIALYEQAYTLRYRSPEHWLHVWQTIYGPLQKAFEALTDEQGTRLAADLITLIGKLNTATDGTMVVPSDYLEVVITRA